MFKFKIRSRRTLDGAKKRGKHRLGACPQNFFIKRANFLSSLFFLTNKRSVFSDPGVFLLGGLSGRLLSSSTIMEPSEMCDVNFPVDRSEKDVALILHLSSLRLSSV